MSEARRLTYTEGNFRAWCEGRKTQTRRIYKGYFIDADDGVRVPCWPDGGKGSCPYGPVGTPLYVAEPFRVVERQVFGGMRVADVDYKWSGVMAVHVVIPESHWDTPTAQPSETFHSSRYFPRWAALRWSRLLGVRVEFLRNISEEDARAEGVKWHIDRNPFYSRSARTEFRYLWDQINARRGYSWAGAGSEWPGYVWALTVAKPTEEAENHG